MIYIYYSQVPFINGDLGGSSCTT